MSALREITGGNGPERDEKFKYLPLYTYTLNYIFMM